MCSVCCASICFLSLNVCAARHAIAFWRNRILKYDCYSGNRDTFTFSHILDILSPTATPLIAFSDRIPICFSHSRHAQCDPDRYTALPFARKKNRLRIFLHKFLSFVPHEWRSDRELVLLWPFFCTSSHFLYAKIQLCLILMGDAGDAGDTAICIYTRSVAPRKAGGDWKYIYAMRLVPAVWWQNCVGRSLIDDEWIWIFIRRRRWVMAFWCYVRIVLR